MGNAPPSSVLWRSLVLTPGAESPPAPPQASRLALRALPVLSPGRGARPWGCPCSCPCCSWRLFRLVSGWACPALPGTPGRGCGWVCVEGPPRVAGQASHPQQTEGVPQCGFSQPLTLLPAPSLERGSPRPEGQFYPPSYIPLQMRCPTVWGHPLCLSWWLQSLSLPPLGHWAQRNPEPLFEMKQPRHLPRGWLHSHPLLLLSHLGISQGSQRENILEMETLPWGVHLQHDPSIHP